MEYQYDLIVIGGGPGGYVPALTAAGYGLHTAVIERDALGGTCLNRGCIPTKTLLHTAELYSEIQKSDLFGIHCEKSSVSMDALVNRKEQVSEDLRKGIQGALKKARVSLLSGTARILSAHEISVTAEESETIYTTDRILIAAGSAPARIPIPGIDLAGVYNSDSLLTRREEPFKHLVIIGGGVIGMEFAAVYQALGTKITVIEALDRLLANMDKEFGQSIKMLLKKRGADIHTGASVQKIGRSGDELICTFKEKDQEQSVSADGILVAVGRRACTEGLFGNGFSVEMERGRILVNENYETSVPGVYAAGDVIGGIQLAHAASAEGNHAIAHMAQKECPVRMDLVPSCVYTSPEIASIGLTADEAKTNGIDAVSVKYPMSANGKTVLTDQDRGFLKLVFTREEKKVLGAQLMCARATDMISLFTTAIANSLTVTEMRRAMYPHPTFSEGISELLELAEKNK